ncbi:MAG: hypothetical protein RR140_02260 [Clostridia bacterium]
MGAFENYKEVNGKIIDTGWIEWDHFLVPNKPEWLRIIFRNLVALFGHCMNCTSLDGCYLVAGNMPKQPLHERCDCTTKPISGNLVKIKAKATCDIRKFTEYVFKNIKNSKGKNKIFYDLGYNIEDSTLLQAEYCKQALAQYLDGKYILKNLDRNGQRLAITISLNGTSFYSGWMLYHEGQIKNTTPFGGWIK